VLDHTEAIRINPKFAEAYYDRGHNYFLLDKKELCIADLKKGAELGDDRAKQLLKAKFNIDY